MGETKLQKNIFTLMMCIGMVTGMTAFNISLHIGLTPEIFKILIKEVWIVFAVALILDLFIVGPLAKKFVFTVIKPKQKIKTILSIAFAMVTSMVLIMSALGCLYKGGFTMEALRIYPHAVGLNFIIALPLNIIIVSPIARGIFTKLFPTEMTTV